MGRAGGGFARLAAESTSMPRNVVLCLDGTSNKYAAANTNVVKLYAMLDRTRIDQLSYYQPGIGTFAPPGVWGHIKQWFITRLDLAIAWLLSDHVTDAYRFLMRYYQDGDLIFIFGFSRGAYTARVLAGMLHGIENRLTPTGETLSDAGDDSDPNVPFEFGAALERFAKAKILPRTIAQDMLDLVRDQKRVEMRKFMGTISRQEYDWYL